MRTVFDILHFAPVYVLSWLWWALQFILPYPKEFPRKCHRRNWFPLSGVRIPERFVLLQACGEANGKVAIVEQERDGDVHMDIFPDNKDLLIKGNRKRANGTLIVEIDRSLPFPVPKVGDRITVTGPFVIDLVHMWTEIHPATWKLL